MQRCPTDLIQRGGYSARFAHNLEMYNNGMMDRVSILVPTWSLCSYRPFWIHLPFKKFTFHRRFLSRGTSPKKHEPQWLRSSEMLGIPHLNLLPVSSLLCNVSLIGKRCHFSSTGICVHWSEYWRDVLINPVPTTERPLRAVGCTQMLYDLSVASVDQSLATQWLINWQPNGCMEILKCDNMTDRRQQNSSFIPQL